MSVILLLVSVLPIILIGLYIYKSDKHKEPKKLLVKLFLAGIFSCIGAIIVSIILPNISYVFSNNISLNYFELFIAIFIGVALVEELFKWIFLYITSYNDPEFDTLFDMIVYSVFVALGFAFLENIIYVFNGGLGTGIIRAFTAIPSHVSDGVLMGYFLGKAKLYQLKKHKNKATLFKIFSILIPVLSHGIYDYCTYYDNIIAMIVFVVVLIVTFIIAIKSIYTISTNDIKFNRKI